MSPETAALVEWMSHYTIVVMFALFVALVAATYWPGRKSRIEAMGRIPFKDDV